MALILRAVEVVDQWRWRWLLLDEAELPLADHQVALDRQSPESDAFEDAYRYVRWNSDAENRLSSEAELVHWIGNFVGERALGVSLGRAIVNAAPVTVRVEVPAGQEWLAFRPWELAHVDGVPLAARADVSLIYDLRVVTSQRKRPVVDALRMLALFSLPTEASPRALRRERYELTRLIRRVSGRSGRRVDLTVAQYGVTKERLRELAQDGEGWDVLHVSGHGAAGEFILETESGTADAVTTEQLVDLLRPARDRLKLVTLSSCQSAAVTTAETLRWLGLDEQARPLEVLANADSQWITAAQSGLARALVERLGCAVVAMRFPVVDDFAIDFADKMYTRILERRQPIGRAVAQSAIAAAGSVPTAGRPALSIGTPATFGASADEMTLTPPKSKPILSVATARMSGFPAEPGRFVGRTAMLAAGSRVLAPRSGQAGIIFHGMVGGGKTACAVELAYGHKDAFAALAFWAAPTDPDLFGDALRQVAMAWESQLREFGFTMVDKIADLRSLEAFLPRLRSVLREAGLLLVLDNLDSLITDSGEWRDPRWALLMDALTTHHGESRVILTSRVLPAQLDSSTICAQPVPALSRDEAVLLARELPNLGALLRPDSPAVRTPRGSLTGSGLARHAIALAQGHPKLLELADAAATDPAHLATVLAEAPADIGSAELAAFLEEGTSVLDSTQFYRALGAWTADVIRTLPPAQLLLLRMLSRLEDTDLLPSIVEITWRPLWDRMQFDGHAPDVRDTSAALQAAALLTNDRDETGEKKERRSYREYNLYPGLAETVRRTTPEKVGRAVDEVLAQFWASAVEYAADEITAGRGEVDLAVRAAVAASAYLVRLDALDDAVYLLKRAGQLGESSPKVAQAVIPTLRRIAEQSSNPAHMAVLFDALILADPQRAEILLRETYDRAAAAGDHRLASSMGGRLVDLLGEHGRFDDALDLLARQAEQTKAAGLGPWSELADEVRHLQVLASVGRHHELLERSLALRALMATLPDQPVDEEFVEPWSVREAVLRVGRYSAAATGEWQRALDLSAELVESERWRGAPPQVVARSRFHDYVPLIRLGRLADADPMLRQCQGLLEQVHDTHEIGHVVAARADLAARRGDVQSAEQLGRDALRLSYFNGNAIDVAERHDDLATYLARRTTVLAIDPEQRAHRLAGSVLLDLAGDNDRLADSVARLGHDLRKEPSPLPAPLPSTVEAIDALFSKSEGIRFRKLVEALVPDPARAERAIERALATARNLDPLDYTVASHVTSWEPVIGAVATASQTSVTPAELAELLNQLGSTKDWTALVAALRRVLAGERDVNRLTAGLDDPIDTAIVRETVQRLATSG